MSVNIMLPMVSLTVVRRTLLLVLTLFIASCGSNDIKDEEFFEPADLIKFDENIRLKRNWSVRIGDGQGKSYTRLEPFYQEGNVYVASSDGVVVRLDATTGKTQWRVKTKLPISGGTSRYEDKVFVGTLTGEAVALSEEGGLIVWRTQLSSEILSVPVSDGEIVIVHCYDGKVYGLRHDNGEKVWEYESQHPRLTLRGGATPVLVGGLAVIGLANGKLIALDTATGIMQWEQRVTIAQGRSEIERIVDVEGTPIIDGNLLFAVSYQGRIIVVDLPNAKTLWRKDASSYVSVAQGYGNVYVVEHDGRINAYKVNDGSLNWQQEGLEWRKLSAPVTLDRYLFVADYDGYLHVFSQIDGSLQGRARVNGSGVRAPLLSYGSNVVAYSNDGKLVSYSLVE